MSIVLKPDRWHAGRRNVHVDGKLVGYCHQEAFKYRSSLWHFYLAGSQHPTASYQSLKHMKELLPAHLATANFVAIRC